VPQDLFSSPPGDDEEPGSFPLPPAAEEEDDPGFPGRDRPAGFWVSCTGGHTVRRPWCPSCCEGLDRDRCDVIPFDSWQNANARSWVYLRMQ
jgi:hypothetical protein